MTTTGSAARNAALWGQRANDWAEMQEGQVRPLYEHVLARFEIGPKMKLLDVGCGAGGFLALAKARGAHVSGLDATRELLDVARAADEATALRGLTSAGPVALATRRPYGTSSGGYRLANKFRYVAARR